MRLYTQLGRQLLNDNWRLDKDDFLGRNFFLSRRLRGCIGRSLFAGDSARHFGWRRFCGRSLEAAPVLRELAAFPAMPGCVKSAVKRLALVLPRRLRSFYSVFFDRSAKRSLLRESKGEQYPARILRAEGCPACPPARHPPLFFALEVLPWLGLPPCEQQQTRARPVCVLQFCCSSSLPLLFV